VEGECRRGSWKGTKGLEEVLGSPPLQVPGV